jgi:acid phosphatase
MLSALFLLLATSQAAPLRYNIKPYDQEALDQYNVLRFLGTASPYIQHPGYGIGRDAPYGCEITQVNFIARHGERYPTKSKGEKIESQLERLSNITEKLDGPLDFLPAYDFIALNSKYYDDETFKGPYSGLGEMFEFGELFRNRYDDLVGNQTDIKFYTASQKRVVESAKKFAEGFLGKAAQNSSFIILDEDDDTLGANSLTPVTSCKSYNSSLNDDLIDSLSFDYLKKTAQRLNSQTLGLKLTTKEVEGLFDYCGFDLNVAGRSAICEIFTTDELLARSYANDVDYYYSKGPGHNLSAPLGEPYVNAVINLLKDDTTNLTMSFAHDTDIFFIVTLLGLFDSELSVEYQDLNSLWKVSNINPMGSRLIFERLECSNETYVRIVHNDAVLPITPISSGPGFSAPLSDFEDYINERLNGNSYAEACGNPNGMAQEMTFFWEN